MQIIKEHISCLTTTEEFPEVVKSTYAEIYVPTEGGYLKHVKLRGGRFARLKVAKLPTTKQVITEVAIPQEEINFLPAGKIPRSYLDQIVFFFKEVCRLKKSNFEAHAWILWSKAKGYYISVPKQSVSAASVNYVIDKDSLPTDSIIVVDYHSHGGMGAFFSGTDDRSDSTGIYYSGVVGRVTDEVQQFVLRFNLYDVKRECTIDDIFEQEAVDVSIPPEWLDKVDVTVFSSPKTLGKYAGNSYLKPYHYRGREGTTVVEHDDDRFSFWGDYANWQMDDETEEERTKSARDYFATSSSPELARLAEDDAGDSETFEYYAAKYNPDVADAYDAVESALIDLSDCDEALLSIVKQSFALLSENGKMKIYTEGL